MTERTKEETENLILAKKIYHLLSPNKMKEDKFGCLKKAYQMGMIEKKDLIDGKSYFGTCRNATIATWNEKENAFTYQRLKFKDTFEESIPHPLDDDGFDFFIPVKTINNKPVLKI